MTHKTTSTIVFEAMLAEAQDNVRKLVKRGVDKKAAARKVATEMDMTFDEAEALQQRVDTAELPTPAEIATPASSNCITFATPTELEQAQGILMYKGVPWSSARNSQLVFDSKDTLNKAHDILKRRWDFVESANRKVAVIEFDNIGEFDRVIDFMRKQNMLMEFGVTGHDLSDDVLDEMKAAQTKPEKGKKAKPLSEDDVAPQDNSYVAVPKDKRDEEINVWDNVKQRTVKARKRWK